MESLLEAYQMRCPDIEACRSELPMSTRLVGVNSLIGEQCMISDWICFFQLFFCWSYKFIEVESLLDYMVMRRRYLKFLVIEFWLQWIVRLISCPKLYCQKISYIYN
jgi:hypothetical protein